VDFFQIWEYFISHNDNDISGRDPSLHTKLIYISYASYTHSLKAILHNIFNDLVHETKFNGVEFSTCAERFRILECVRFWIGDAQTVPMIREGSLRRTQRAVPRSWLWHSGKPPSLPGP
jgi:hypothetical protein